MENQKELTNSNDIGFFVFVLGIIAAVPICLILLTRMMAFDQGFEVGKCTGYCSAQNKIGDFIPISEQCVCKEASEVNKPNIKN